MTDRKEIWKLIATNSGVDMADQHADAILDAYKRRFVSFTRDNLPSWRDVMDGCIFEDIPMRAVSERDGVCIVFSAKPIHTMYLPIDPCQSPERYWEDYAIEFMGGVIDLLEL